MMKRNDLMNWRIDDWRIDDWRPLIGRDTQKVNKKDKTGQATHIFCQSL